MTTKIEALKLQDLFSFWDVFAQVLKNDFPGYSEKVVNHFLTQLYNKASFDYWLKTGWKIVIVAKEDNKIVGFAIIDKPYGGVCFCRWLGVLPDFRKKGIGKKLINEWEQVAKMHKCHKLEIASQPTAVEFYKKCDLTLEGKREKSYFGIDQTIFGKVIGKPSEEEMIGD